MTSEHKSHRPSFTNPVIKKNITGDKGYNEKFVSLNQFIEWKLEDDNLASFKLNCFERVLLNIPKANYTKNLTEETKNKLNPYFSINLLLDNLKKSEKETPLYDANIEKIKSLNETFKENPSIEKDKLIAELENLQFADETNKTLLKTAINNLEDQKLLDELIDQHLTNIAQQKGLITFGYKNEESQKKEDPSKNNIHSKNNDDEDVLNWISPIADDLGTGDGFYIFKEIPDPNKPEENNSAMVKALTFSFSNYYITSWDTQQKEQKNAFNTIMRHMFVTPGSHKKVFSDNPQRCEVMCRAVIAKGAYLDSVRINEDPNRTTAQMWIKISKVKESVYNDGSFQSRLDRHKEIFTRLKSAISKPDQQRAWYFWKNPKPYVEPTHLSKWLSTLSQEEFKELYQNLSDEQKKQVDSEYLANHPDLQNYVSDKDQSTITTADEIILSDSSSNNKF